MDYSNNLSSKCLYEAINNISEIKNLKPGEISEVIYSALDQLDKAHLTNPDENIEVATRMLSLLVVHLELSDPEVLLQLQLNKEAANENVNVIRLFADSDRMQR